MRSSLIVVLFVSLLPFVTPIATLTVFEILENVIQITKTLIELSFSINDRVGLLETAENAEERIFSQLDHTNLRLADIDEQLHSIGEDVNEIVKILRKLPVIIQLQLQLHDIRSRQVFLNAYYSEMEKYVRDFREYENSTLLTFADNVVSSKSNSVPILMKVIYEKVTSPDFLQPFYKHLVDTPTSYLCGEQQSLQEVFHKFLNEIVLLNTKSYILTQTAYMIKKTYGIGKFVKEIKDSTKEFKQRTNGLIRSIKPYMVQASAELRRCEPAKHKEGETFVQITNFLHGYVINKINIDQNGGCRYECDTYTYTKTRNCYDNSWCNKEPTCPKAVKCQYVDVSMNVCSKKIHETNRRIQYIQLSNGQVYGKKDICPRQDITSLSTYIYWVIWRCSYCFCLCEEGPKFFSDIYINLRPTLTNLRENRVVTGVRFTKHNQIIHLQIQEGKLLPFGQIDLDSVRWVPPENYTLLGNVTHKDIDYHMITWEERGFELADIKARNGSVVTGVRFTKVGTRLHLEVRSTPFNFTSGQLNPHKSTFEDDPDLIWKHKFGNELKLTRPDIPTLSPSPPTDFTTNKYVQFVNSDLVKDAAQTTVPFFDAQPVASSKPVPLEGIGVFHKGRSGYGGFITPRIFTYNFGKHLEPVVFSPDNVKKPRKN